MSRLDEFRRAVCAALLLGVGVTATAAPITDPSELSPGFKLIDFEDFDTEGRVTTPLPNPVTFGDLTFTSLTGTGPSIFDISVAGRGSPDGPVFNNTMFPGAEPDSAISIGFAEPVSEFLVGWGDPDFEGNVLRAFDLNGQLLEEAFPELRTGAAWVGFKRPTADIARVIVQPDQSQPSGDDYEIDNIHYTTVAEPGIFTVVKLVGDKDSFGTGLPHGQPVVPNNMVHETEDGAFDQPCSRFGDTCTWSHVYAIPEGYRIVEATLTIVSIDIEDAGAGDGLGGGPFDTLLFLDGIEVPGAFDDTFTPDLTVDKPIPPNTTVFSLQPEFFSLLSDGNVAVLVNPAGGERLDAVWFDHAELRIIVERVSPYTTVVIDIKPRSDRNCLNINGHGVIPVATLGSPDFNVEHIDQTTLLFAGLDVRETKKGRLRCRLKDINIDGYWDLICRFEDDVAKWMPDSDTQATLTGNLLELFGGSAFQGTDSFCLKRRKDAEELGEPIEPEEAIESQPTTEEDNLNPRPWWAY